MPDRYTDELTLALAIAALPPGKVMGGLAPSATFPNTFGWCTLRHLRYRLNPDTTLAASGNRKYLDTVVVDPAVLDADWLRDTRRCAVCNRPINDHINTPRNEP